MDRNNNSSAIIVVIGIIIISVLLATSFFIYFKSKDQSPELDVKDKYHTLSIENKSPLLYTIVLPSGEHIDFEPGKIRSISLSIGDTISALAYSHDGTVIKYIYKLSNLKINHLFIGNSGIFSNLSSGNVTFINNSKYPIMFVEKSIEGGKRWGSNIIPPGGRSEENFVYRRGIWQVVHPTDEDNPIAHITIGAIPKNLLFDGKNLKAM